MRRARLLTRFILAAVTGLALWASIPGTIGNYLVRAAVGELELLADREPIDQVLATDAFTGKERERLSQVARVKAFGLTIGLAPSGSYEAISPHWQRTIWNVSSCSPTRFRNRSWWFPIVGRVPYLGYFDEGIARRAASKLALRGDDVYVRTAGAYSTLGWFDDPVLPGMLRYTEADLADTILHEMTHATLWVPGSVAFNESLASFVGEVSADRYMVATYGLQSEHVANARAIRARRDALRDVLHEVYGELDGVYTDAALTNAQKKNVKARILATIPLRIARLNLPDSAKATAWAQREQWNNARLLQFRTYNRRREWFQALLDTHGGDLPSFLSDLERITKGADDPSAALANAVGAVDFEPSPHR